MQQKFFMYRGFPLVRSGNEMFYGYMSDSYVANIQIKHTTKQGDLEVADKVIVYKMKTDESDPFKAITNKAERDSLYAALDLAHAWLERQ